MIKMVFVLDYDKGSERGGRQITRQQARKEKIHRLFKKQNPSK